MSLPQKSAHMHADSERHDHDEHSSAEHHLDSSTATGDKEMAEDGAAHGHDHSTHSH
jgi:hypothetical protein